MRIDAHQHFWEFNPVRDNWITTDMKVIQNDFYPRDLIPLLKTHQMDGCVAVQASQSEEETAFLVQLANENSFIKGVVGWTDLQADTIEERLSYYKQFQVVKGFRHVLQGEPQRDLMLTPAFQRGIRSLSAFNYTYDILIFPDQLVYCYDLVKAFPNQLFIIDHLAKPYIRNKDIKQWKDDIRTIAQFPNVYCKLSGMVTETEWAGWKPADFEPYIDVVFEAFGVNRVVFGSDWPVCLLAATYDQVVGLLESYMGTLSKAEQDKVFGENAVQFYQL